jgi:hypothetical protein
MLVALSDLSIFLARRSKAMDYTPYILVFGALALLIVIAVFVARGNARLREAEAAKVNALTPQEREEYQEQKRVRAELARKQAQEHSDSWAYGKVNPAMLCPHCQTRGRVRTKLVDRKQGVSGGKATAAILTGGVSLLATGLSRKQEVTQAFCGECRNLWYF